jgi:hypothetical protein
VLRWLLNKRGVNKSNTNKSLGAMGREMLSNLVTKTAAASAALEDAKRPAFVIHDVADQVRKNISTFPFLTSDVENEALTTTFLSVF